MSGREVVRGEVGLGSLPFPCGHGVSLPSPRLGYLSCRIGAVPSQGGVRVPGGPFQRTGAELMAWDTAHELLLLITRVHFALLSDSGPIPSQGQSVGFSSRIRVHNRVQCDTTRMVVYQPIIHL